MSRIGIMTKPRVKAWNWTEKTDFYAIEGSDVTCTGLESMFSCTASILDEEGNMSIFDLGKFDVVEMITGNVEFLMENVEGNVKTTHLFKELHVCYEDYPEEGSETNKLACEIPDEMP